MKKTWISLLIIFVVLVVGIGFISIASIAYEGGGLFMFQTSGNGTVELMNTLELDISDIDSIDIKYSSEDIVFYRGESDKLIIKEYLFNNGEDIQAKVIQKGSSLEIKQGKRYNRNFFFQFNWETQRIEVYLPESYGGNLGALTQSGDISSQVSWEWTECALMASSGDINVEEIKAKAVSISTSSGDIETSNISAEDVSLSASSGNMNIANITAGEISVSTNSGDMEMGHLSAEKICFSSSSGYMDMADITAGELSIVTSSGNITMAEISADKMDASSSSGDMKFKSIQGSKKLSSSSGEISIGCLTGDTVISTNSGSITLQIPASDSFTVKVQTTSGDIRTDFDDVLSFNKKGNRAEGTYGSGKVYAIDLSASSGDVSVKLKR